ALSSHSPCTSAWQSAHAPHGGAAGGAANVRWHGRPALATGAAAPSTRIALIRIIGRAIGHAIGHLGDVISHAMGGRIGGAGAVATSRKPSRNGSLLPKLRRGKT